MRKNVKARVVEDNGFPQPNFGEDVGFGVRLGLSVNPRYKMTTTEQITKQVKAEQAGILKEVEQLLAIRDLKPELNRSLQQFLYIKFRILRQKLITHKKNLCMLYPEVKEKFGDDSLTKVK